MSLPAILNPGADAARRDFACAADSTVSSAPVAPLEGDASGGPTTFQSLFAVFLGDSGGVPAGSARVADAVTADENLPPDELSLPPVLPLIAGAESPPSGAQGLPGAASINTDIDADAVADPAQAPDPMLIANFIAGADIRGGAADGKSAEADLPVVSAAELARDIARRPDLAARAEAQRGEDASLPVRTGAGDLAVPSSPQLPVPPGQAMTGAAFRQALDAGVQGDGMKALMQTVEGVSPGLSNSAASASGHLQQSYGSSAERAGPGWQLGTPMQTPQWGDEVGQRLRWMVNNQVQTAELRINPPQLGSVEIRISVQHDQMNILFSTPHALVRETLEDAIPRLRELMSGNGFSTVNVDVSQHSSPQERGPDADLPEAQALDSRPEEGGDHAGSASLHPWRSASNYVDIYA